MHQPSDEPDPNRPPEAKPADAAANPAPTGEANVAGEGERSVHDVIAALQAEVADYKDRWLRAQAETENVRKRYEREKEDTAKYAITKFARELINILERHGIKRLNPKDEPFNPHLHQAMMEVPRSDVAPGTIVQVFQPG